MSIQDTNPIAAPMQRLQTVVQGSVKQITSEAVEQKLNSSVEIFSQMMNRTVEALKPVTEFARKLYDKIPTPKFLTEFAAATGFDKVGKEVKSGLKFFITALFTAAVGSVGVGWSFIGFIAGGAIGKLMEAYKKYVKGEVKAVEAEKKKMIGESYAVHHGVYGSLIPVVVPILFVVMLLYGSEQKQKDQTAATQSKLMPQRAM